MERKSYVKIKFAEDIDLEVDKSYVVFLSPRAGKGEEMDYYMDGMQYGLREVRESGPDATALNNETKKWESISSFVKFD